MLRTIVKEIRPRQWLKNVFVLVPLVFALKLLDPPSVVAALGAFVAFCLISSAVYVLNDIIDREQDSQHPIKSSRPIASGELTVGAAAAVAAVCTVASLAIALWINVSVLIVVAIYAVLQTAYSITLKHVPIVDVLCIASGFLLRVAAGAYALEVPVSTWVFLTVLTLALFMGFNKRYGEIRDLGDDGHTRRVLTLYSGRFLERAALAMLVLSVVFYSLWALEVGTVHQNIDGFVLTIPLVVVAFLFYSLEIDAGKGDADPTAVVLRSRGLQVTLLLYVATIVSIFYVIA